MGNVITPLEKARELEKHILNQSGLILDKDLFICEIPLDNLGENHIHTLVSGIDNTDNLVIMHGYGGSSVFFFQVLEDLSKHYKVFCIDHLGMGLSSRPKFSCENLEQTLNYFIDSFEIWRKKIDLKGKFTLCGHSFGGYIAAQYTRKFPELINGLILLSPLGFTKGNLDWEFLESDVYTSNLPFFKRFLHKKRLEFFKEKGTVSEIANSKMAYFLGPIAKYFWKRRFKNLSSETTNQLWLFLQEIFKLPQNSEEALHFIINPNFIAYDPIEGFVDEIKAPISVLYGDNDWMCHKGALRYWKNCNDEENKDRFRLIFVEDCEHQMTITNPKGLIEHFITKKDVIKKFFKDLEILEL